ncbi:hypothetical protein BT96DRAFT_942352 [Gymnopus androsaceus JB14]|uniref:Uncharacterized protein n=1 Tax=Gymnopus androsaceus JB14 TaxID=1447944 RepID=A0A6A4HBY6_9AGAR|nr:hypothetical protein BT96DRAFT_942352 [Gymnopus androsaceus JB14]
MSIYIYSERGKKKYHEGMNLVVTCKSGCRSMDLWSKKKQRKQIQGWHYAQERQTWSVFKYAKKWANKVLWWNFPSMKRHGVESLRFSYVVVVSPANAPDLNTAADRNIREDE